MTLDDLERPIRTHVENAFYGVDQNKKAEQSQGEPRDAAVNFGTCRILQHRAASLSKFPARALLSCIVASGAQCNILLNAL